MGLSKAPSPLPFGGVLLSGGNLSFLPLPFKGRG